MVYVEGVRGSQNRPHGLCRGSQRESEGVRGSQRESGGSREGLYSDRKKYSRMSEC